MTESSEETPGLAELAERIVLEVSAKIKEILAESEHDPADKCAALLESVTVAAIRSAVEQGCAWNQAVWAMRATLGYIEQAHVEELRQRMASQVGEPKPGEERTALSTAERLIEIAPTYTPKSDR